MNTNIKNVLSIAVLIFAVAISYASIKFVSSYDKAIEPSSFRSFNVSAEGKAVAVPDVAQFSFSVVTEGGRDITRLQQENTEKMNRAIAFVKERGVEDRDIRTTQYNIRPRQQFSPCPRDAVSCPPSEIVGYTVSQSVVVKVRDFTVIGDLLSGVAQNGANIVSQLSFTVDDPAEVESQARAEAITRAQEKAQAVADAGGFRLGRLLGIEEGGFMPYRSAFDMMPEAAFGMGEDKAVAPPSVEPGSQEIRVNVILRYEIQ